MYFWTEYLCQLNNLKDIKFAYSINDNGDILVRIRPTMEFINYKTKEMFNLLSFKDQKDEEDDEILQESIKNCSFFYFIPSKNSSTKEFLYFDSKSDDIWDLKGCSMNENFIFFWNNSVVWSCDLKTQVLNRIPI